MKAAPQKYILYYPSVINKIPITLYFRFVSFSKVPLAHLMIFFFLGNLLLFILHCFHSLLPFYSCQEGAKENGIDFIDQKKIYNKKSGDFPLLHVSFQRIDFLSKIIMI